MINSIEKIEDKDLKEIKENYLTFILACAFTIDGNKGCYSLQKLLSNNQLPEYSENNTYSICFQFSPFTCKDPNSGPGGKARSTIDLVFGNIAKRSDTESEIVYQPQNNCTGDVYFVEMKTSTDIGVKSTDNPNYNQFAKYIKSALTIQKYGRELEKKYPKNIHVNLVTPKIFIENPKSRLYGYKFKEYSGSDKIEQIKKDIPSIITHEYFNDYWLDPFRDTYIDKRLNDLNLHWVPFEDLLDNVPESSIKKYIDDIRDKNRIFMKKRI